MAMLSYWYIGRQRIQTSTYISAPTTHYNIFSVVRTLLYRNRNILTEEQHI